MAQAPAPEPESRRGCVPLGLGSTSIACLDVGLLLVFLSLIVLLPAGVLYAYQRERGLPTDWASLTALARGPRPPWDQEPLLPPEDKEDETEAAIEAAEFEGTMQYPLLEQGLRSFFQRHVRPLLALRKCVRGWRRRVGGMPGHGRGKRTWNGE